MIIIAWLVIVIGILYIGFLILILMLLFKSMVKGYPMEVNLHMNFFSLYIHADGEKREVDVIIDKFEDIE